MSYEEYTIFITFFSGALGVLMAAVWCVSALWRRLLARLRNTPRRRGYSAGVVYNFDEQDRLRLSKRRR